MDDSKAERRSSSMTVLLLAFRRVAVTEKRHQNGRCALSRFLKHGMTYRLVEQGREVLAVHEERPDGHCLLAFPA